MSSRPLRWFGGLVAGLVLLGVVSVIPGTGLGPVKVTEAQPYGVLGQVGGEQQAAAASSSNSCPSFLAWLCRR